MARPNVQEAKRRAQRRIGGAKCFVADFHRRYAEHADHRASEQSPTFKTLQHALGAPLCRQALSCPHALLATRRGLTS